MELLAQVVGIFAVLLFLLSYQQKKRRNIIALNALSRVLYIIQYIMLGAFSGAVLDVLGTVSSVAAQKKNSAFIKRHLKLTIIIINVLIVIIGFSLYENIFSILPILGVLFHTGAFWLEEERAVRCMSLIGSPFWLIYNFVTHAYGSVIGDILSIISIIVAILRYDVVKKKSNKGEENDKIKLLFRRR
ncbi:MAG: YgjV family protein [Clostridia bacterium]|nr:YgjV family protein [Clostridia bacterium]